MAITIMQSILDHKKPNLYVVISNEPLQCQLLRLTTYQGYSQKLATTGSTKKVFDLMKATAEKFCKYKHFPPEIDIFEPIFLYRPKQVFGKLILCIIIVWRNPICCVDLYGSTS